MDHKSPYVTNEAFEKHSKEDFDNFTALRLQNEKIEEERRKRHGEVMDMINEVNKKLQPVFEAFDFRKRLDEKGMKAIVRWTKILGFVLLIVAVVVYIWKTFVFGVNQVIK